MRFPIHAPVGLLWLLIHVLAISYGFQLMSLWFPAIVLSISLQFLTFPYKVGCDFLCFLVRLLAISIYFPIHVPVISYGFPSMFLWFPSCSYPFVWDFLWFPIYFLVISYGFLSVPVGSQQTRNRFVLWLAGPGNHKSYKSEPGFGEVPIFSLKAAFKKRIGNPNKYLNKKTQE